ncbi:hypothetical protein [Aneurinibacillus tyrosinisolvens]|uniref:hypothetical protein n=1 Tax=Aneurinibacillus tyrosinisolvens TaxID=1443435 RepID=UPI00063F50A3|nr:hypothetical protein [Aneurinibacillus tyrosinisolvens]
MKKKVIGGLILSSALVASIVAGTAYGTWTPDQDKQLGEKFAQNEKAAKVVGTAKGEPVLSTDIKNKEDFLTSVQKIDPTEASKQAIDEAYTEALVYKEAKDRHVDVSWDDALAFAKTQRDILENNKSQNADEVETSIKKVIEGLGISEEEYWTKYVVKNYQKINSIAALQGDVTKDETDPQKKAEKWQAFVNNLKKENPFKNQNQ